MSTERVSREKIYFQILIAFIVVVLIVLCTTAYSSFRLRQITSFELKNIHGKKFNLYVPVRYVSEAIRGKSFDCTTEKGQYGLFYDPGTKRIYIKLFTAIPFGGFTSASYEVVDMDVKKRISDFLDSQFNGKDK